MNNNTTDGAESKEPNRVSLKQFKDPIYGYVEIDATLVSGIVDTPTFQRLKDVRQTSYTPLFPSAHHNRYVHSIGVYHLGQIAFQAIRSQLLKESEGTEIETKIPLLHTVFGLACLLHDVGHAPFSHTGEDFYIDKADTLYNALKESVDEADFTKDFDALGTNKPAPHECMSCVVGLRIFCDYFHTPMQRSLFARCITGMYIRLNVAPPKELGDDAPSEQKQRLKREREAHKAKAKEIELVNCVISLLNSSIIDVDRLDYIIRDAATIGFKNVQVDYNRLLKGMHIVRNEGKLCVGYHKSALSVIESAVYAHDAERKWIQSHPSILYEIEVLKNAMGALTALFASKADPNPLFCYEALTESGKILTVTKPLISDEAQKICKNGGLWSSAAKELLKDGNLLHAESGISVENLSIVEEYPISLLADEDVLYLMKRFCKAGNNGFGYEYFARNQRRSAVWKSEAEFRALFQAQIGDGSKRIQTLEDDFKGLVEYCQDKLGIPIVTKNIYAQLKKERKKAERSMVAAEIDDENYQDILAGIETKTRWAHVLEDAAKKLEIPFEFLIIFQKKFSSSFKSIIGDIPIFFPNLNDSVIPFKDVVDVLNPTSDRKSNFFHIFYRTDQPIDTGKKKEIISTLARALIAGTNV